MQKAGFHFFLTNPIASGTALQILPMPPARPWNFSALLTHRSPVPGPGRRLMEGAQTPVIWICGAIGRGKHSL